MNRRQKFIYFHSQFLEWVSFCSLLTEHSPPPPVLLSLPESEFWICGGRKSIRVLRDVTLKLILGQSRDAGGVPSYNGPLTCGIQFPLCWRSEGSERRRHGRRLRWHGRLGRGCSRAGLISAPIHCIGGSDSRNRRRACHEILAARNRLYNIPTALALRRRWQSAAFILFPKMIPRRATC